MEIKKFLIFAGTRPEAIKLAPVIKELYKHPEEFKVKICFTGQHREMIYQVFLDFGLKPDIELDVMEPNQTLAGLSSRLFNSVDKVLESERPDWVLVQGDTTTVMVVSLCTFYRRIRLAHVEAGLRSFDRFAPFPEEINRRIAGIVADLHFAPTEKAKENLLREGVFPQCILTTGNTVVDALLWIIETQRGEKPTIPSAVENIISEGKKIILITGHRRENFGNGLKNICAAMVRLSIMHPDVFFIYPVHLNPNVREPVYETLNAKENIILLDPIAYRPFVYLLNSAFAVLTDSGGIQEEAPSLGKPVLITRNKTERPEAIEAGIAKLVGTDTNNIISEINKLLSDTAYYNAMSKAANPYGDGHAANRIVKALIQWPRIRRC